MKAIAALALLVFGNLVSAQTVPPPIAGLGFVNSFYDPFNAHTVSTGGVYKKGKLWYQGEQCCMGGPVADFSLAETALTGATFIALNPPLKGIKNGNNIAVSLDALDGDGNHLVFYTTANGDPVGRTVNISSPLPSQASAKEIVYQSQPGIMYPTPVAGKVWNPYEYISGGGLNITLREVDKSTQPTWTSGVIKSYDNSGKGFTQGYGYFQITTQLPKGPGTWPSFWMLTPPGSAVNAELDIFEQYGLSLNTFCTTAHEWSLGLTAFHVCGISSWADGTPFPDFYLSPHTWGVLWTPTNMTFYLDNKCFLQEPTPQSFQSVPEGLLVDNGWSSGFPIGPSPQVMTINSVSAWQNPSNNWPSPSCGKP